MRRIVMAGKLYGRLSVLEESGKYCLAECDCGNIKRYLRGNVLAGYTQSCGCLHRERATIANTKHGQKTSAGASPTYVSWRAMHARCGNPKADNYQWYGGKGIRVCERWNDFNAFIVDMGERPEGLELGRQDDTKDYSKDNCRWMTHKENLNLR